MIQFIVDKERCISCGECAADCPMGIIDFDGTVPEISAENEGKCIACQHCFAVCPQAAVSIFGLHPDAVKPIAGNLPDPRQLEMLIKGRRSIRRFRPEGIDPKITNELIQIVSHAPTGKNTRQNLFTVVDSAEVMEKVRRKTMAGVKKAVETNTLPSGMEFFGGVLKAWDSGRDVIFRGAPHLLIVSSPKDGPSPEADTLIAMTTFDLLARGMGFGTLWNGFAKWAITLVVPEMRRILGIPETHHLGYVMSFGIPAVEYYRVVDRGPAKIQRVLNEML